MSRPVQFSLLLTGLLFLVGQSRAHAAGGASDSKSGAKDAAAASKSASTAKTATPKPAPAPVYPSAAFAAMAKTPPVPASEAARELDKLLTKDVFTDKSGKVVSKPAARADDATFLRRVTLDITGETPSAEELTRFSLDPSMKKRNDYVDQLLATDAYGQNWAHYWRDVIFARRTEDRAMLGAPAATSYLAAEFNKNTPWDQLARAFITATGDVRENGATAIIMSQMAEDADVTAEMARIFLGVQIACAQCHDHPTDRWKRQQFHELAAFFPRISIRPKQDGEMRSFEVVSVDREPRVKRPNIKGSTEHYMPDLKDPAAKGTLMQPVFFLSGDRLPTGKTDQERRNAIAIWMTSPRNQWFAKAFVNRLWSELVGEGFYEPVDDMGPDRKATAPEAIDYLASQFVAHKFDVKWVFQTITATDAYQRQSRSRHSPSETPFLANCPQRMRADQVYGALTTALGIADEGPLAGRAAANPKFALRTPRGRFLETFGYDPSVRRDEVAGSIPQALLMMNSPEVNRAINGRANTALADLLATTKDNDAIVTELYLRSLAREPKETELKTCLDYVSKVGNRPEAFEDILWSLVNSTEFLNRR